MRGSRCATGPGEEVGPIALCGCKDCADQRQPKSEISAKRQAVSGQFDHDAVPRTASGASGWATKYLFHTRTVSVYKGADPGRLNWKSRITGSCWGESPDPPPVRIDAPADPGVAGTDRLTVDGGQRRSEERAHHGRGVRRSGRAPCHDSGRMVRALRHEIHVTRTFHTSAVWQVKKAAESKMAQSEMSVQGSLAKVRTCKSFCSPSRNISEPACCKGPGRDRGREKCCEELF
jgi:hypothetical protein